MNKEKNEKRKRKSSSVVNAEKMEGRKKNWGEEKEKKNCRDQDSNLGYYGHNVMS